jgi:hypothetical protein
MKAYGRVEGQFTILGHEDRWMSGQLYEPVDLPRDKSPGTHWIGDFVGPRAGIDDAQTWKFLKNAVFWDVTPCDSCKNRRFEGTNHVNHQGDMNR